MISCHEISKFYPVGDGLFALRDVEIEVQEGSFVVIMGPSGSGKTTVLNILGGIDRPTHGEVILKGRKFSRLSEDNLAILRRTEIGMVFQFFNLLPELTAVENIGLPMRLAGYKDDAIAERASDLLGAVGLLDRMQHYPSELSGGEQQRVAICRALATRPAVVLADEPTGNLDSARSKEIMELFSKFNKEEKQTFIIATHEPSFIEYADIMIRIIDGEIVERSDRHGTLI
ncbi:MAG TPA: ABC transporter ATP-binding protein [Firmicutes bacterium]|nr:ABC transporter ATP-binding protein [Candidatus Fermentithermobacillaceae bacterium]